MTGHGRDYVAVSQAMQRHLGVPPSNDNKKSSSDRGQTPDDKTIAQRPQGKKDPFNKPRPSNPEWFKPRQPDDVPLDHNGENVDGN